eukprot:Skav222546  [mRNA]  locus=scaffold2837:45225:52049:+ [translate_table: standard]
MHAARDNSQYATQKSQAAVTEALLPGGSLSPLSRAANPLLATFGGVVGPAATYALVTVIFYSAGGLDQPMCLPADASHGSNATDDHDHNRRLAGGASGEYSPSDYTEKCSLEAVLKGWGIPTATDISLAWMFAILIFGPGHAAINFLLLLAILDDALGMIIIAASWSAWDGEAVAFYPDPENPVEPIWLLLVLAAPRRNVNGGVMVVNQGGLTGAAVRADHGEISW